ncbi:MAG: hypothetical protein ACREOQ_18130 [Gemmatimonadales bacterium]
MNHSRQDWKRAVIPGLALAALASAGAASATVGPKLPKDPCALLKPTEIQAALAPSATIGAGVPANDMAPLGVSCDYIWGPHTPQWGESSVTVTVLDVSQAYPGLSADQIAQGVRAQAMAKDATVSTSLISGVGDAAVFKFEARPFNATGEAFLAGKGVYLSVQFHGGNPGTKDKVIALLKQAAGRL